MSSLRIHLLNVGKGDCILIQFPDKSWGIVDCGEYNKPYNPCNQAAAFLNTEEPADTPVRFVLATHPDSDHDGGISELLQLLSREVHIVYYSGVNRKSMMHCGSWNDEDEETSFVDVAKWMVKTGKIQKDVKVLQQGDSISFDPPIDGIHVSVLWPPGGRVDSANKKNILRGPERNNVSIVLKIEFSGRIVILAGDIQGKEVCDEVFGDLEENLNVIKAPHHGSKNTLVPWSEINSGKEERFVLVSCPTDSEQHPHVSFLSSVPTGVEGWKIRCTGLSQHCAEHQTGVAWPMLYDTGSYLWDSCRRHLSTQAAFIAVSRKGRTFALEEHIECSIANEVIINEEGEVKHIESDRMCDKRLPTFNGGEKV